MDKIDRAFTVVTLMFISIAAISRIGRDYYALLAMFELLVGAVIGMTIFIPNKSA